MLDDRITAAVPGRSPRTARTLRGPAPAHLGPSEAQRLGDEPTVRLVFPSVAFPQLMGDTARPLTLEPARPQNQPHPGLDRLRTIAGLGAVIILGFTLRAVGVYDTPVPGADEAALVTQVADLSNMGSGAASQLAGRAGPLSLAQLSGLVRVSDGWDRAPSALGALREVSLASWLVMALLCWVLARRMGISRGWVLAGIGVLALCPTAITSARLAVPENLAACWAVAALALAAGPVRTGRHQLRTDLTITGVFTVGTLTSPMAAAVFPALILVAARYGDARRTITLASLCLPAAIGAPVISGLLRLGPTPGSGPASWLASGWLGHDLVTPVVVVLVTVLTIRSAEGREIGVGLLSVGVAALWLGIPVSGLHPMIVPLIAVGLARIGDDIRIPEPGDLPAAVAGIALLVPTGVLAPAAAVVLVSIGWAGNLWALPGATAAPPTEWARDWVIGNVAGNERVMTDAVLHTALAKGAAGWTRVATPALCATRARLSASPTYAGDCSGSEWWVVGGSDLGHGSGAPGGSGAVNPPPRACLIARFGEQGDPGRIEVWTTYAAAPDPAREQLGRQAAGRMLTVSPHLETTPDVADRLRTGSLDSRAATALGGMLTERRIRLVALPEILGEQAIGRPLRQMLITPGRPDPSSRASPDTAQSIVDFFTAQLAPFRPYALAITPDGVLVRYSPQGPPGLLDSLLPQ